MTTAIKYTVTLTLTVPCDEDNPELADYNTQRERSNVERSIIRAWKLDGDVDCEVLGVEIIQD